MNSDNIVMWVTRLSIVDWVYFQDSDFAGDLEDSKSTSVRVFCIFGSRTFVHISWMCKKQTSVFHSSTESEIISLDAVDLWDIVIEVLRSTNNTVQPHRLAQRNLCGTGDQSISKTKSKAPTEKSMRDVGKCQTWITYPPHTFFSRRLSVV